jgi:hypothetical protein
VDGSSHGGAETVLVDLLVPEGGFALSRNRGFVPEEVSHSVNEFTATGSSSLKV